MNPIRLLAATLAAFTCAAGAQTLKPGLWEVTQKMSGGQMDQAMAEMQKQLAAMPPEQRKQMEAMMAGQGMKLGPGGPGGGMSMKMCMTREMVEKDQLPTQQGDCRTTRQSRSGNTMSFAVACTSPPSTGEGQVTFTSPEAYSMKMAINSQVQGKPERMQVEGGGKWLAADCGNLKPLAMPPPMKK